MKGMSIAGIVIGGLGLLVALTSTPLDGEALIGWLFGATAFLLAFGIVGVVKTKKK